MADAMPRSVLCGRSYTLMHAEELRAGLVLWPEPSNVSCVQDLVGFVKSPPVRPELVRSSSRSGSKKRNGASTSSARTETGGGGVLPLRQAAPDTSPWWGRLGLG